ncbi:MAG: AlpA family transcriptional regulator [Methylobacter sp.]|nr:AlpA family transcriptional regulator [Methylobacter sp.]
MNKVNSSAPTSQSQILRIAAVLALTGLSRSTIYGLIRAGDFPRQLKLGPRSSGWYLREIQNWLSEKANSRA